MDYIPFSLPSPPPISFLFINRLPSMSFAFLIYPSAITGSVLYLLTGTSRSRPEVSEEGKGKAYAIRASSCNKRSIFHRARRKDHFPARSFAFPRRARARARHCRIRHPLSRLAIFRRRIQRAGTGCGSTLEYIRVEIKNVCQCAECEAEIVVDRSFARPFPAITED